MCCVHTTSAQGDCSASSDREQLSREHNSGAQGPARKWVSVLLGCTTGRGEITQRGERSSSRPATGRAAGPSWPCLHVTVPLSATSPLSGQAAGSVLMAGRLQPKLCCGDRGAVAALQGTPWLWDPSGQEQRTMRPSRSGGVQVDAHQSLMRGGAPSTSKFGISPAPNASCFYRSHLV